MSGETAATPLERACAVLLMLGVLLQCAYLIDGFQNSRKLRARIAELQAELAATAEIGAQDKTLKQSKEQLGIHINLIRDLKSVQRDPAPTWIRGLELLPPEACPGSARFRGEDGGVECDAPAALEPELLKLASALRLDARVSSAEVIRNGRSGVKIVVIAAPPIVTAAP